MKVPVEVTDNRSDADKYNPEGQKVTTDLNKEPDASEGIKNKEDLPKGTTYTWKEKVDVSTAGNKKGIVVVTYPDGSKEEVEVTISVEDKKHRINLKLILLQRVTKLLLVKLNQMQR